jgi:SAM-dependent methyltransferase
MSSKAWYEDWFADEHYLALYNHRNSQEASLALDLIERSTHILKDAAILDLACGAGRHAIGLAKRGYTNITAIDLSPTLLSEAEKNAKLENVEIIFRKQDMRHFSGKYDLVINLFTSFGYFESDEENEKVILKIGEHLQAKGFFVLDFLNAIPLKGNCIPHDEKKLPSGERIEQFRKMHSNRIEKKIIIHAENYSKEYHESVRLFTLEDFKPMFERAGLTLKEIFGDYAGNPYDEGSSPRLILVAQR